MGSEQDTPSPAAECSTEHQLTWPDGNSGRFVLFPAVMADQAFLDHGGHQEPVPGVDFAEGQSPRLAGVGALHRIQQPVIHAKRPVKPHGVVQAGDLHLRLPEVLSVGVKRCHHQTVIGGIGQQILVDGRILRHPVDGLDPIVSQRLALLRRKGIHGIYRPDLDRPPTQKLLADGGRDLVGDPVRQLQLGSEASGAGHAGCRVLVFKPRLVDLKRGRQVENRPALLNGHDPAGGEALAVADAIDVVDDRPADIPRPEKIGMQAVGRALRRHGLVGGRQRLPQYLSAVDVAEAEILALAAKDVLLDLLQLQQFQQFFQYIAFNAGIHHGAFPRRQVRPAIPSDSIARSRVLGTI